MEVFGATHAEVGAYLLGLWNLPDPVVEAVAYHHAPSRCVNRQWSALTLIHVAESIATELTESSADPAHTGLDPEYDPEGNFEARLPVWRSLCRAEMMEHHPMNEPSRSGVVLLVDDDVLLLAGLQRALRGQPFNVRVAPGAYEAMSLMQAWGGVDVLITDQHMPGMSGTALLSAVRERFPDTARFMLTGRPDLSIAMEAINSGAIHRFFVKPCDAREMVGAIQDALRERMIAAAARLTSGPMLLVDVARCRITHGNAAAATLFGVDPGALQDRAVDEVLVDDGPGAQGAVEAFLAESPPATRRWRARRSDASLRTSRSSRTRSRKAARPRVSRFATSASCPGSRPR